MKINKLLLLAVVAVGCCSATVAEARAPRCRVAYEQVVECRRPCYRPVYVQAYRCPPPVVVVQQPCYVEPVYIYEPCCYERVVYRQPSVGFSFSWMFR